MSPEHFNEIVGIVLKTTGMQQYKLAEHLDISLFTIRRWKVKGIEKHKVPMVMSKIREFLKCYS